MDSVLKLFLLIASFFVRNLGLSANQEGICSKTILGEPECCLNYRKIGINCEECWPGTYGENCNEDCPSGRYGRFCIMVCQCAACSKVTGCPQNTSSGIRGFEVRPTTEILRPRDTADNFKENFERASDPSSKISTGTFPFTGVKKLEGNENISSTYTYERNGSDEDIWTVTHRGSKNEQKYEKSTQILTNLEEKNGSVVDTNANTKTVEESGLKWWIILVAFGFIFLGIALGCIFSKKCVVVRQPAIYFHSDIVNDRKDLEQNAYNVLEKNKNREKHIYSQTPRTSSSLQVYVEIDDCIQEFSTSDCSK